MQQLILTKDQEMRNLPLPLLRSALATKDEDHLRAAFQSLHDYHIEMSSSLIWTYHLEGAEGKTCFDLLLDTLDKNPQGIYADNLLSNLFAVLNLYIKEQVAISGNSLLKISGLIDKVASSASKNLAIRCCTIAIEAASPKLLEHNDQTLEEPTRTPLTIIRRAFVRHPHNLLLRELTKQAILHAPISAWNYFSCERNHNVISLLKGLLEKPELLSPEKYRLLSSWLSTAKAQPSLVTAAQTLFSQEDGREEMTRADKQPLDNKIIKRILEWKKGRLPNLPKSIRGGTYKVYCNLESLIQDIKDDPKYSFTAAAIKSIYGESCRDLMLYSELTVAVEALRAAGEKLEKSFEPMKVYIGSS